MIKISRKEISSLAFKAKNYFGKLADISARWLYLVLLLGAAVYCCFIWYKFVYRPEWSEERKREYIKNQSSFFFSERDYRNALNILKTRKENYENYPSSKVRDIFYPDSFNEQRPMDNDQ